MELEKCGMCDFPEVTHHCAECPVYLCSRCSISHTRSKATNTHALADFTRVTTGTTIAPAEEPSLSAEPVPTFCSTHQDLQISIFCSTCNDIICRKCQQISHIDHQICDVDESKMNLQRLCLDNIKRLFDTSSTLETVDEELQSTKVANTQKLHQIETELTHRKNTLFKHINSTYDESLSKVQNEKKRIQQVFERVTNERKDSMKLSQELKAKLFNVQHTDDISSLVSIVKDFNNVFPNIEHAVVTSSTDAVRSNCKGFLQSKDNADRALSTVQQYLGLEINGPSSTLKDDKSTLVSNVAQRKTANKVDVTSADDCGSSTLKVDIISPRSGMPISPQGPSSTLKDDKSTLVSNGAHRKTANKVDVTSADDCGSSTLEMDIISPRSGMPISPQATRATDQQRGTIKIAGRRVSSQLEIVGGDLTDEKTDAIVHATDTEWSFQNSVVGQAIMKKGGKVVIDERNKARSSTDGTGKITGISEGGDLDCKFVIHLDMSCKASIDDLIYACLVEARNNKLSSVSFPALGTGKLRVDPGDIATAFKTAIKRFYDSTEYCSLSRVRIVIFEKQMIDKFIDILEGLKTF